MLLNSIQTFTNKSLQILSTNFTCKFQAPKFLITHISNDDKWCNIIENVTIHHENMEIVATNVDENTRIDSFAAVSKKIFFFPKGIEKFTQHLVNLVIKNCKLKKITSKNLEKFTFLQYLDLSYNEIEVLEENLFTMKSTILYLVLNDNKIKDVHYSVFKSNGHMYLDLENNTCVSKLADDSLEVNKLIKLIKLQCKFYHKLQENELSNNQGNFTSDVEKIINRSSNGLNLTLYLILALIGFFLISITASLLYKNYNKRTSRIRNSNREGIDKNVTFNIPNHGNIYESQVFYEEIKYDKIHQGQTSQMEDFYDELNTNNEIMEPELYADVYKPNN